MIVWSAGLGHASQAILRCFDAWGAKCVTTIMLSGRPRVIPSQKKKTGTIAHGGVLTGLCNLEEAEAKYLNMLRKARPDLAEQVRHPRRVERRPPRKEWHPK